MDEQWIREFIASLVMDLEKQYIRAEVYKAIIQSALRHGPDILSDWESLTHELAQEPAVLERVGQKFFPLLNVAIRDLDAVAAQVLLDKIRALHEDEAL
jgi:hypothetical protein